MPVTPSTAKKPQDRKSKTNKPGFGKRAVYPLDLPSGHTVQVRRPGVNGLVKAGILESLDSLTSIVQTETIPKAEGQPLVDVKTIMKDPKKLNDMLAMMDKIVLYCVVAPQLSPKPVVHENPEDETSPIVEDPTDEQLDAVRDDELAYVDLVDDNDKTFIMSFALGGQGDHASFRQAAEEALASSLDGEAAASQAE
jgi:hypothetical protein